MTDLTCRRLTCDELFSLPKFDELVKEYGEEISFDGLEPNIKKGAYKYLEAQGCLGIIGVFLKDELVGIASWMLFDQLHFQGNLTATVESIWVAPECRKLGAGALLINELWRCAAEDGAKGLFLTAKIGTRAAKIFGHIAKPISTIFWKKLEE